jgi:hypothetical protein
MGFKKTISINGGFEAEYWNMGRIADVTRTSKNYGTDENPDMRQIERADVYMRCYKDRQSYIDDTKQVEQKLVSVEYPYNTKVSRQDIYSMIKEQVEFFNDAEDAIE